jgi:hypothetical protein
MGTVAETATIVTCRTNGISPSYRIPGQFLDAAVRFQLAYHALNGDAGSTFKIARLPKGAVFLWLDVVYAALTGAVTGMLGDAGDTDRLIATGGITSMASAGKQHVLPRAGDYTLTSAGVYTAGTLGAGYVYTADTDILLTTEAANITGTPRADFVTAYALVAG